ncbi:MAG: hypothetical protein QOG03_2026 [Actinomycetota bacterium]|jgi:hypothetical protein|nr:hypothetical protein [Actinomycetota bacterium]
MSVAPSRRDRARSWILIAGLAVAAAVLLLVFVLRLSHTTGAKTQLGTDVFVVGKATTFAPKVKATGPLLFADLRAHSRQLNVYVQHVGADPRRGWMAFDAHTPDDVRCLVALDRRTLGLRDCHGHPYPPDGAGLTHYKVTIDPADQVVVDLSQPAA